MREHEVVLPDESGCIVEFKQEGLVGIANIRSALREFQPKEVFSWHLSVMLQLKELVENGMPSKAEQKVIDTFGDMLEAAFIGDPAHPNSLFLARITWNGTRELIYRVYEPEPIHSYLKHVIEADICPRPFDYKMQHDPEWKLAEWHLNATQKT